MRCFGFLAAVALFILSCGSGAAQRGGPGAGGSSSGSLGVGGAIGSTGTGNIGNPNDGGGAGGAPNLDGKVTPAGSTVTVSGQPVDVPFHFTLTDGSEPRVVWIVDDTRIGSIGADGVFRANGYVGGVVTITATTGGGKSSTQLTVNVNITDNPIGLPPADQGALVSGGTGDAAFRWLYPYDQTVFPRGLPSPTLQFGGAVADTTYLKITAPYFSYQQFASTAVPTRVTIRDPVWRGLTLTAGPKDTATVEVTKRGGGQITGPVKESWSIAQASLKGIVYYATYKSPLAPGNGAIMSLRPGQNAQVVLQLAVCTGCHTVSASGNVLSAGLNYSIAEPNADDNYNPIDSATYNLSAAGTVGQRTLAPEGRLFSFTALTPNGNVALVNGLPPNRWPPFIMHGEFAPSGFRSRLVDTATGAEIVAPSLAQNVTYAQTPAFSPDGKHVAFANGDRLDRRVLSEMDYDGATTPPTFSNPRDLVNQATPALAWPSFLPDATGIVYHEGDSFDSRFFMPPPTPSGPQYSEIRLVETADRTIKTLDALNGHLAGGALYLPYGAAIEGRMNYEPNVIPVAVGGYFWVLFTSRRAYGNTISPDSTAPPGADPWGNDNAPSPRKKIWIAAIDVDHPTKVDPSHPAFYLPGQEIESGNMRAFAALAPCKPQGGDCESGADCCDGFCRETGRSADGGTTLQCVPPPVNQCSNADETCQSAADCCNPTYLCINNRCALPPPPR